MKSEQDVSSSFMTSEQPPSRPDSRASACCTRTASPLSTSRPGSGTSRPGSGGDSSARHPIRMPKAPQSKEVAQRLIMNSNLRPIARFDSADYFLNLHNAEQKRLSEAVERGDEQHKLEKAEQQMPDSGERLDQTP